MAAGTTLDEKPLFDGLKALKAAWPMGGWSWDSRLSSVASTFAVHHSPSARAAVDKAFTAAWTVDTIKTAPERVRAIAERYEGVRRGQLLLTGGDVNGLLAFGLWWPWETSETISLRVGLADVDESRSQHARFRDIFSVSL
jgi:hypothetical protein